MAQFDVHRNPGRSSISIPYVVVAQSAIFDGYRRRIVIPLVRKTSLNQVSLTRLNPTFRIEGDTVVLHPLEIVSVATNDLGAYVMSLADHGQDIVDALDEVFARAFG